MGEIVVSPIPATSSSRSDSAPASAWRSSTAQAGVAGLAHVVLPESPGATGPPGKFADLAVPGAYRPAGAAGASQRALEPR